MNHAMVQKSMGTRTDSDRINRAAGYPQSEDAVEGDDVTLAVTDIS